MTLCKMCTSITLDKLQGPGNDRMYGHQPTFFALKSSAEAGCQLCSYIWHAVGQDHNPDLAREKQAVREGITPELPGRQLLLCAWSEPQGVDRLHITTTADVPSPTESEDEAGIVDPTLPPHCQSMLYGFLDLYAYDTDPAAHIGGISGRPLPIDVGGSDDQALIKSWLQECTSSHERCHLSSKTELPKRVLHLLPSAHNGCTVQLLEPAEIVFARYATLSHCWGGTMPLVATSKNLAALKSGIPMEQLPKTFREAVTIALSLHIAYIWIDSLCILQDSRDDWEDQAPRMCDIYANAFLNIAARGAMNCHVGCFIQRPNPPAACCLPLSSQDGSAQGLMHIRDPAFKHESVADAPLDQRAWVFQERLLSSRILYFGAQQLYWECNTTTLRQDGRSPDVMEDSMRSLDFKSALYFDSRFGRPSLDLVSSPRHERYWRWYRIVEGYTKRKLTHQSDILAAISGVAIAFAAAVHDDYIAGLWKGDLVNGLTWGTYRYRSGGSSHVTGRQAIQDSRLPSWSWARAYGPISYAVASRSFTTLDHDGDLGCKVIDINYRLSTKAIPGQIEDAKIFLSGRLLVAKYVPAWGVEVRTNDGSHFGTLAADYEGYLSMPQVMHCFLLRDSYSGPIALALRNVNGSEQCFERVGVVRLPAGAFNASLEKFKLCELTTISVI